MRRAANNFVSENRKFSIQTKTQHTHTHIYTNVNTIKQQGKHFLKLHRNNIGAGKKTVLSVKKKTQTIYKTNKNISKKKITFTNTIKQQPKKSGKQQTVEGLANQCCL